MNNIRGTEHDKLEQRLNAGYFLVAEGDNRTVFDDNTHDWLTGSSGTDWFFANLVRAGGGEDESVLDDVTDLRLPEVADDLEWILSP